MITNDAYPMVRALHRAGEWAAALDLLGDADPELRAQILVDWHFWSVGDHDAAEAAIAALDPASVRARYLSAALAYARVLFNRGARPDDPQVIESGFRAALDDPALSGWANFKLGIFADNVMHDPATALAHFEAAHKLCEGDPMLESYVVRHLGGHLLDAGRRDEAIDLLRRSLHLRAALGARPQVGAAAATLAGELPEGPERDTLRQTAALVGTDLNVPFLR
ncbi:hypothetical protein [Allorhizocola rhizosphaerae]|uniref:hypothetical protein n=1 Tax=Allorhizocola rhizosphaerae TaxID=1872709 RepID=UPI001B8C5521|nr:hypothetical protein [Allorhizocola rhizosphaerae]